MDTQHLILAFGGLIKQIVNLLMAIAILVFVWGLVKFIFKIGGDEKAAAEGKNFMGWGLLALFVIFSVWGIVNLLGSELGIEQLRTLPR